MAKRKHRHISVIVDEQGIQFELKIGEKTTHQYRAIAIEPVRVRVPRPDPKQLLESSRTYASEGFFGGSAKDCVSDYIHYCHREISKQLHEIRKSSLRIERQLECIGICRQVLDSL